MGLSSNGKTKGARFEGAATHLKKASRTGVIREAHICEVQCFAIFYQRLSCRLFWNLFPFPYKAC